MNPTIQITDQGFIAFCALLGIIFSGVFVLLSKHGDRLTRIEVTQEFYMRSVERNRRGDVVTDNPLSKIEKIALERVTDDESNPTLAELQISAAALYREAMDPERTEAERGKYLDMLYVVDARKGLREYELERQQMPFWKRLIQDLR